MEPDGLMDMAACLWAKDNAPESPLADAAYLIEAARTQAILARVKRR